MVLGAGPAGALSGSCERLLIVFGLFHCTIV